MCLWCLIQEQVRMSRTKLEPQTSTWQRVREPMGKQILLNGHTQSMQELAESTAALGGCAWSFQCSSSSWPGLLHSVSLGYSLTEKEKGLQLLPFSSSQQILIRSQEFHLCQFTNLGYPYPKYSVCLKRFKPCVFYYTMMCGEQKSLCRYSRNEHKTPGSKNYSNCRGFG